MRRLTSSFAVAALLAGGLAACGSDDDSGITDRGSVEATGAFGSTPQVTMDTPYQVSNTKVEVLTEGTGAEIPKGGSAFVNLWMANGFTGKVIDSAWPDAQTNTDPSVTEGPAATETPTAIESPTATEKPKSGDTDAAGESEATATFVTTGEDTIPAINKAVEGHTVGSRVMVSADADDGFGLGGSEMGVANADTVVFIVDIVSEVRDAVDASTAVAPAGLPKVVEADGKVTGLDFTGTAKKPKPGLQVVPLVKGDGPKIANGSQVALRYLGQVWGKEKPFDENYSKPSPTVGDQPVTVGTGGVIKGWDKGLVGLTVGTRALLVIPAALGYGDKGQGEDIKPGDTLVFVVDILGTD